jgi:hypothetical protein
MKFKDVRPGHCFRFLLSDRSVPDHDPMVVTDTPGDPAGLPRSKNPLWATWYYEGESDDSAFYHEFRDHEVELLEHYSTHPTPTPLVRGEPERRDLVHGDCFVYLDSPGSFYIVGDHRTEISGAPDNWNMSTRTSAAGRWENKVRRIPHWNTGETPAKTEPVILPCIDPFKGLRDAIFVREEKHVDGLRGKECLARFERGQQTESIAATGAGYVCTNAECALTSAQIHHARDLWSYKLRLKAAEQKAADADAARRDTLACDDVDEMPNMATVK